MRRLRVSALAESDLDAIADYIAADSTVRALGFVRELRGQCQQVAEFPLAYRVRPELGEGLRACPFGGYMIYFMVSEEEVFIARILHASRDPFSKNTNDI
jgi:toxin ParE1/3/4